MLTLNIKSCKWLRDQKFYFSDPHEGKYDSLEVPKAIQNQFLHIKYKKRSTCPSDTEQAFSFSMHDSYKFVVRRDEQ